MDQAPTSSFFFSYSARSSPLQLSIQSGLTRWGTEEYTGGQGRRSWLGSVRKQAARPEVPILHSQHPAHVNAWKVWVPSGHSEGSSREGMLTNSVPYGSWGGGGAEQGGPVLGMHVREGW